MRTQTQTLFFLYSYSCYLFVIYIYRFIQTVHQNKIPVCMCVCARVFAGVSDFFSNVNPTSVQYVAVTARHTATTVSFTVMPV